MHDIVNDIPLGPMRVFDFIRQVTYTLATEHGIVAMVVCLCVVVMFLVATFGMAITPAEKRVLSGEARNITFISCTSVAAVSFIAILAIIGIGTLSI